MHPTPERAFTNHHPGLGIQPIAPLNSHDIDPIFTANCIGHQILTTLLLSLVKKGTTTAPHGSRIVVASSSLHKLCHVLDLSALTRPTHKWPSLHDGVWRYARAKLGNILFARELSRRLLEEGERDHDPDPASSRIFVNAYFPGNVVTQQWQGWSEHLGSVLGAVIRWVGRMIGQSVEDAAATAVFLAASPEVMKKESRGKYYVPIATVDEPTRLGKDDELGRKLWVCVFNFW